jgi:hypothetical protein
MMLRQNRCDERRSMRMPGLVLVAALATASVGPASGQGSGAGAGGSAGGTAAGGSSTSSPPGTNAAGTGQSGDEPFPRGSITVGRPGNPAGGTNIGRIDGTVTPGPSLPGDDQIRSESSKNSEADRRIKSICKGC